MMLLGIYLWALFGAFVMATLDSRANRGMTEHLEMWVWPVWACILLALFWPAGVVWWWRRWR